MNTLLLRLVGPMQSWGHRSRFDNRDTGLEPTRSGVIGLLCAALGRPRSCSLEPFECLRMGVRVDAPGKVEVDYHTALNVVNADGSGSGTVTSHRYYLADARFLVGLETADPAFLRTLEDALRKPVWPLCLGRKSFPLALPPVLPNPGESIRQGVGLEEALERELWQPLRTWEKMPESLRMVVEPQNSTAGMQQADMPLSFASRRFGLRTVATSWTTMLPQKGAVLPCISHG